MIRALLRNFLRGLLVVVPASVTLYIAYAVFVTIDGWVNVEPLLRRRVPGAGVLLTLVLITLCGFLATNFATRWLFGAVDRFFARTPLIKLVYTSVKELIAAFVGARRGFDSPVVVSLDAAGHVSVLGFVTRSDVGELGLPRHVAVYVPQSYNFAGNLVLVPAERVRAISAGGAAVMTMIVSGGMAGDGGAALPQEVRLR